MASNHTLPGGNIVKVPDYGDAADVPASLKLYGESLESALVPVGVVLPYAGLTNAIPDGWLLCDGSTFSGTDYPRLQAVLGRTTTPNLTGRMPIGVDGSDPDIDATFKAAGSKTIDSDQVPVPSHGHEVTVTNGAANATHTHNNGETDGSTQSVDAQSHDHGLRIKEGDTFVKTGSGKGMVLTTSADDIRSLVGGAQAYDHAHGIASADANHTHETTVVVADADGTAASKGYLPPVLALNFIIRGK